MAKLIFDHHRVNSRKDLLHFVEEEDDPKVYERIGENPGAWIEELNILSQIVTNDPLMGGSGIDQPPVGDPDFRELGNGAFLYRGEMDRLRGLWIRKNDGQTLEDITGDAFEWTLYRMGTRAELKINQEFSDVAPEEFLPENFEQKAQPVAQDKHPKRPILTFPITSQGNEIVVYAKGADVSVGYYYESSRPKYRLTSISAVLKTTSKKEMEIFQKLGGLGVKVPRVVGYYEAPVEEFLFLEGISGSSPTEFFGTHRQKIIRQDAQMLAALCLAGYRKLGFADFDDKVFDGNDLFLIDVDECRNLYFPARPDFREILLHPTDPTALREFRELQRDIFMGTLRDALFDYRNSLTLTDQDKKEYIGAFHQRIGWTTPDESHIRELINFPDDYMTHDRYMSLMSDTE